MLSTIKYIMIETGKVKFDFIMAKLYIASFHPLLKTSQNWNFACTIIFDHDVLMNARQIPMEREFPLQSEAKFTLFKSRTIAIRIILHI